MTEITKTTDENGKVVYRGTLFLDTTELEKEYKKWQASRQKKCFFYGMVGLGAAILLNIIRENAKPKAKYQAAFSETYDYDRDAYLDLLGRNQENRTKGEVYQNIPTELLFGVFDTRIF